MGHFKKQIHINSSNETVWKVLADLGGIYKFNPSVKKSYYTSIQKEGFGAARICELYSEGKVLETVRDWKPNRGFILEVSALEKAPPVKNFTAHFRIHNDIQRVTTVEIEISYDMKLGAIGKILDKVVIQASLEKNIEELLKGLNLNVTKGLEITDRVFLREQLNIV